jgi:hypothetical protein
MFNLFGNKRDKGMKDIEQALQNLTHLVPATPAPAPPQEHYRIGFNQELDMVTVTLLSGQTSMTLHLDRPELTRFKNMLDAAASVDAPVTESKP